MQCLLDARRGIGILSGREIDPRVKRSDFPPVTDGRTLPMSQWITFVLISECQA